MRKALTDNITEIVSGVYSMAHDFNEQELLQVEAASVFLKNIVDYERRRREPKAQEEPLPARNPQKS